MRGRGGADEPASSRTVANLPVVSHLVRRTRVRDRAARRVARAAAFAHDYGIGGNRQRRVSRSRLRSASWIAFPTASALSISRRSATEAFVTSTIASLLEIGAARSGSIEALVAALRIRRLLLIFDNCEHVSDAAAKAAGAILRDSPGVTISGDEPPAASDLRRDALSLTEPRPAAEGDYKRRRRASVLRDRSFRTARERSGQHFEFTDESRRPGRRDLPAPRRHRARDRTCRRTPSSVRPARDASENRAALRRALGEATRCSGAPSDANGGARVELRTARRSRTRAASPARDLLARLPARGGGARRRRSRRSAGSGRGCTDHR